LKNQPWQNLILKAISILANSRLLYTRSASIARKLRESPTILDMITLQIRIDPISFDIYRWFLLIRSAAFFNDFLCCDKSKNEGSPKVKLPPLKREVHLRTPLVLNHEKGLCLSHVYVFDC